MKRFWKDVTIAATGGGLMIELDGRPVRLPSGRPLTTPLQALADGIAQEWAKAPADFSPENLPFTRLASTAQERIAPHRNNIIRQLAAYGMNDLLCYRAEAPEELAARQSRRWGHWLSWAETAYGVRLLWTSGLTPIDQPPGSLDIFTATLSSCSDETLAALGVIVPALGSLVLGLALMAKAIDPRTACDTAFLDELWQEDQWGRDDEAARRRAGVVEDVVISTEFMSLSSP